MIPDARIVAGPSYAGPDLALTLVLLAPFLVGAGLAVIMGCRPRVVPVAGGRRRRYTDEQVRRLCPAIAERMKARLP